MNIKTNSNTCTQLSQRFWLAFDAMIVNNEFRASQILTCCNPSENTAINDGVNRRSKEQKPRKYMKQYNVL